MRIMSGLKEKFETEVLPALMSEGGYANRMQVPRLVKIVINGGFDTSVDANQRETVAADFAAITGQRPVFTKARKSIANFKLREGMIVGLKATLRGNRMYEFLDRLINVACPRMHDFRGLPADSFDGRGNYSMGLREQTVFPEIDPDDVKVSQGMDIVMVTSAETDEQAKRLLRLLGMPFSNE